MAEIQEVRATLDQREKDLRELLQRLKASTDKTKDIGSVCPVHKVKMRIETVPIVYGMMTILRSDPPTKIREGTFPFASRYWRGGCVSNEYSPATARIYVCPDCVRAEKQWNNQHKSK